MALQADKPLRQELPATRRPVRVLTICTVDITLAKLLKGMIYALRDAGYDSEAACAEGLHAQEFRNAGIATHAIPFQRRVLTANHILAFLRLYRLLRQGQYDIVHVHTPFAQVIGRIAAKLAGVPIILYTSHGFQFHESRPRWARAAILQLERWLGQWTDVIFTQSREDAETATRSGIAPRERVLWIGNGIELERFEPGPLDPSVRAEFGLGPDQKIVGFIGRVVREKGIVELVEAMANVVARLPEARLLIVGDTLDSDGDVAAKALIQQAIATHSLEHAVRFAGLREDLPRLLRTMDLMVLPSWREGMPRSIIEAMATGIPVVATNIRGCREEVVHGKTGLLVPPRCPGELAVAILTLLSDAERTREMGAQGRCRALECFDERKVIERQLSAYRQLVEERGLAYQSHSSSNGYRR